MIPSKLPCLFVAVISWFTGSDPCPAASGDQDLSFGAGGMAMTPFPPVFRSLQAMAIQSNGRIVGVGPADNISSSIGIVRWLATGAVDLDFGTAGTTTLAVTPVEKVRVALTPDDRIVVVANRQLNATNYDILVWRLLGTGAVDPDFGTGGQVVIQPPAGKSELAHCVTVQTDGKIVVGGGSNDGFFLLRLDTKGDVDATFGIDGTVRSITPYQHYRITALAQQPDGALVGSGWQKDGTVARDPFILRLVPSGVPDLTFGTNGFRFLFAEGELNALTLRGDGAIIAAGAYQGDALVTVLRASGGRDLLFAPDNDGRLFNLGGTEAIHAVTVQSNGRIILSGSTLSGSTTSAVTGGIRSDGVWDEHFGAGGANYHNFLQEFNGASQSNVETVASLPDGTLLVGGLLYGLGYSGAVLHRLKADITLHPIESWRIQNFGTRTNAGAGADAADPDLDGVPNLAEYAFNQDPKNSLSRTVPMPSIQGGNLRLAFPDPDATKARKVSFRAEASAVLTVGSWIQLPETGDPTNYLFDLPMAPNPSAFVRLLVDLNP